MKFRGKDVMENLEKEHFDKIADRRSL